MVDGARWPTLQRRIRLHRRRHDYQLWLGRYFAVHIDTKTTAEGHDAGEFVEENERQ